jgi:hypothetical protein
MTVEVPRQAAGSWAGEIALAAARTWVRFYTAGAPPEARDERRSELASDIWEQTQSPHQDPRDGDGLHVLLRALLGAPSDVAWRLEHATLPGAVLALGAAIVGRAASGWGWTVRRGLPGVTWLLAGGYVLVGLLVLIVMAAGGGEKPPSEQAWGGALLVAFGLLIAAGFRVACRRPKLGIGLMLAGTAPFAIAFHATIVIPVASFAALLAAFLRMRSRRLLTD